MLISMLHKRRDESCNPLGEFETSSPIGSVVGPLKKCVKEAEIPLGSRTMDNMQQACSSDSLELGQCFSDSSGSSCPPGFEDFV